MTDAAFVIVGWVGTAAAVGVYALRLRLRLRRAATPTRRAPR